MAIFLNRGMKFSDLSDDLKLMVTKWLEYEDKMKLVDIFPPVVQQIRTFDMNDYNHPNVGRNYHLSGTKHQNFPVYGQSYSTKGAQLFKKLNYVKRIVLPSLKVQQSSGYKKLDKVIFEGKNYGLQKFARINRTGVKTDAANRIRYIEHVLKRVPTYTGKGIEDVFQLGNRSIMKLLKQNPNLSLKLHAHSKIDLKQLVRYASDPRTCDMITCFNIAKPEVVNELPSGLVFKSVTYLGLEDFWCEEDAVVTEQLKGVLKHVPNTTNLVICLRLNAHFDAGRFANCINSIDKLQSLRVMFMNEEPNEANIVQFNAVVDLLLTSNRCPLLKVLKIDGAWFPFDIAEKLALDIRTGLKELNLYGVKGGQFIIHGDRMLISKSDPPLVVALEKFDRVKRIDIYSLNGDYVEETKAAFEAFKDNLPRNKVVRMDAVVGQTKPPKIRFLGFVDPWGEDTDSD